MVSVGGRCGRSGASAVRSALLALVLQSLLDGKLGYTPAGMWKPKPALSRISLATRAEVRRRAKGRGEAEEGGVVSFQVRARVGLGGEEGVG